MKRPPINDFAAWAQLLAHIHTKAMGKAEKRDDAIRPRERALNVFKLISYHYLRELEEGDHIADLRNYIESRDGARRKGFSDRNALWVLRLVAWDEKSDRRRKLRSRLAAELTLASLNKVRPALLLGFLFEAGAMPLIEKDARSGTIYNWAEDYR